MLLLIGAAFLAGMITVVAPCVLPLLPVIIGGSVTGNTADRKRPLVITVSLAISLIVFTLLLKATTVFINIPPQLLTYISGAIITVLGLVTLFPMAYSWVMEKLGIESRAQAVLQEGFKKKNSLVGPIIIGAALGPVFSSCSPVYAYILATVLPVSFGEALVYIIAYVLGLSAVLLTVGFYGQKAVRKIKFASNPNGWFRRIMAIIFIVVGMLIFTGYDKKVQTWVSIHTPFNFDAFSARLIPSKQAPIAEGQEFNVTPYEEPALVGLDTWINSQPLTLSELKGKVVLVDFWTYSCINCIRNTPYLEGWYKAYADKGFVIIGVHAPEFAFEKVPANVRQGVKDLGITYPVALDNGFNTWNAFKNQYWPAGYLIDASGKVRRIHYGEGEYAQSEQAIRGLLQENGADLSAIPATDGSVTVPVSSAQTPETYLGSDKASNYEGFPALAAQPTSTFTPAASLALNEWTLGGTWEVQGENIVARGGSTLTFRMASKAAYVVAESAAGAEKMQVLVDGKPITADISGADVTDGQVTVNESRLYRLVAQPSFNSDYTLQLVVPDGVSLNAFTFGS